MVDLVPPARQQFLDLNQSPLAGGQVFMFVPNTTIPKGTFQDQAGTVPNTNPVVLDGVGSAAIWGSGLYRQVVTDSLGTVLWDALTNPPGELNGTGTNAGIVVWFATENAPTGFLICDGNAVSRVDNALLFAAIGTQWGVGDGSTTFNVPDLRGQFIRALDIGKGVDSGRTFGSLQGDATNAANLTATAGSLAVSGSISGTLTLPGNPGAGVGAESGGQNVGKDGSYSVTVPSGALVPTLTVTGAPAVTAQTETRPTNIALLPCISTGQGAGNTNGGVVLLTINSANPGTFDLTKDMSLVLCQTSGMITINPPANPNPGQVFWVKDSFGNAAACPVTFNFTIDGVFGTQIGTNFGVARIVNIGPDDWSML